METDEQVSAELTAVETPETTTETVNDSEVVENSTDNVDRGDLRVPLKQTREELRQFKERLNDPDFILEKAAELGLVTNDEPTQNSGQSQQFGQPQNIESVVKIELEKEKAREKYKSLRTNEAYQYAVTAYMNKGMSPMKAADKFFAELQKEREEAAQISAEEERAVIKDQERAQTIISSSDKSSEDAEYDRLVKQSKNKFNPREAEKAIIELQKLKLKK